LAVSKQAAQKLNGERFNLSNELEVRKEYQIEISNRFTVLENISDSEDINRGWENFKGNSKTSPTESLGLHKLKQHKPWFDQECSGLLDQRKQAKMQWVQVSSQSNVDNLNNKRPETSLHFRDKKKEYMKAKLRT
jgi:hypothetical protein